MPACGLTGGRPTIAQDNDRSKPLSDRSVTLDKSRMSYTIGDHEEITYHWWMPVPTGAERKERCSHHRWLAWSIYATVYHSGAWFDQLG